MGRFQIAVVTTTRAEYGLLHPLLAKMRDDEEVDLFILVSGAHLSHKHGYTINEIKKDGFDIAARIPILEASNDPLGVSLTTCNALHGFAEYFHKHKPDLLVVTGDRTEMMAIAIAAMIERIPMAHYSGGDVTQGAIDDCIRHSISKMSYLHFTTTEAYRKRVIQLGESPDRVFATGALSADNIRTAPLMSENEIRRDVGVPERIRYAVVTLHPVTQEDHTAGRQAEMLCSIMEGRQEFFFIITKANADVGGDEINRKFEDFCTTHKNGVLIDSLGMIRYLSAVKYASFVLGNSSSGIVEAPILGTPTVNIGDRQKGRLFTDTIISCGANKKSINEAIDKALLTAHIPTSIYGDGNAAEKMLQIIKSTLKEGKIDLKKAFYDVGGETVLQDVSGERIQSVSQQ